MLYLNKFNNHIHNVNEKHIFHYFKHYFFSFCACSNSDWLDCSEPDETTIKNFFNTKVDSLPPNDFGIPYTGVPRIVIETESYRKIKNRETEIPAKLQIWSEEKAESEVMNLTIKGRGNSTWKYPKKPYAIKFEDKQSFLGMPKAKNWVLLANYRDRTLIRNAIAFELARKTSLRWTPSGKFADVFLNKEFLGNYYICEKIEVKKNRLELDENSYLLEFDKYYDEDFKFRSPYNDFPINIKYPKEPDSSQFKFIENFIDSVESALQMSDNIKYLDYINQESFADYFIIYAISTTTELGHPKSFYMHKNYNGKLEAGPVWDFDYATFDINKDGFTNKDSKLVSQFWGKESFQETLKKRWKILTPTFNAIYDYIDSLANYTKASNSVNIELWPIELNAHKVGDEEKTFDQAIQMLKKALQKKINEIDTLLQN